MTRRISPLLIVAGAIASLVLTSAPSLGAPAVEPAASGSITGGKVTVVMDRALVAALVKDGVTWQATDGARVTENGSSVIWTFAAEPSRGTVNLAAGSMTVDLAGGMEFVGQGLRKDYNVLRVSVAAGTGMLEGQVNGAWTGIAIMGAAKVPSRATGNSLRVKPFEVYVAPGTFMVMTDDGMTSIAPSVGSSQVFGAIGMKLKVK